MPGDATTTSRHLEARMDPQPQFCHNPECSERGVVGGGNIVIHSRAEHRYQCRWCQRTFR